MSIYRNCGILDEIILTCIWLVILTVMIPYDFCCEKVISYWNKIKAVFSRNKPEEFIDPEAHE